MFGFKSGRHISGDTGLAVNLRWIFMFVLCFFFAVAEWMPLWIFWTPSSVWPPSKASVKTPKTPRWIHGEKPELAGENVGENHGERLVKSLVKTL